MTHRLEELEHADSASYIADGRVQARCFTCTAEASATCVVLSLRRHDDAIRPAPDDGLLVLGRHIHDCRPCRYRGLRQGWRITCECSGHGFNHARDGQRLLTLFAEVPAEHVTLDGYEVCLRLRASTTVLSVFGGARCLIIDDCLRAA